MAFNKAKALQEAEKSVAQGKSAQAIKQYLFVFEKDPADLGLLNTVGDLYIRDKNLPEALKYFHKLAESYTQEGFTVKAVAIYKKISKLDSAGVDVLLKMAELYVVQGLTREAREQYTQAVEFYKKKNQTDKALEVFRKIVALDPENTVYRIRFAEFCEAIGKKADATKAYLEGVELGLRRGDTVAAETALKKAVNLEANSPRILILQARLALAKNQPEEVEKIIDSNPEMKSDPTACQLLLDSYLARHKLEAAEKIVVEVFRSSPAGFSSVKSYAELCISIDEIDSAYKPLAAVADEIVDLGNAGPLMELLREIWSKRPDHIPTLELVYRIAEKTADELTLPEVLDALGHAYVKAGELEKAENVYRQLVNREPENEEFKGLLKQVLQKQGKEAPAPITQDLSNVEMALTPDSEVAPAAEPATASAGAEEAAMVKEALDNSDLFTRYGLADKAFAELDKVLAVYPDQVDIHKRILEISQKANPARATQAAEALARIYKERNDLASAKRYEHLAGQVTAATASEQIPGAPPAPSPPEEAPAPASVATEFDLSAEFLGGTTAETPGPTEPVPIDLTAPDLAESPAPSPINEFDLSGGWEEPTPPAEAPPPVPAAARAEPAAAPGFNFEDSRVEVVYYLDQGFLDEAQNAVHALEEKFPGNAQVAELRSRVELRTPTTPKAEEAEVSAGTASGSGAEWEVPGSFAEAPPAEAPVEMPSPAEEPTPAHEEGPATIEELAPTREEAPSPIEAPPPEPGEPEKVSVEAGSPPSQSPFGGDELGGLIGELEASLDGIDTAVPSPPPPARPQQPAPMSASSASGGVGSPLSGFLDELSEGEGQASQDDPQTHYDLGVAFREMNLLDEAIGEFQKVVKGVQKGHFPPNYLQACTLLALCFMDKKLPAIAIKWYLRALEMPDLDEEATMAVNYDMGVAYEQAGDMRNALEKFSEVYSQNIDYRDVAEKIRLLQTKS